MAVKDITLRNNAGDTLIVDTAKTLVNGTDVFVLSTKALFPKTMFSQYIVIGTTIDPYSEHNINKYSVIIDRQIPENMKQTNGIKITLGGENYIAINVNRGQTILQDTTVNGTLECTGTITCNGIMCPDGYSEINSLSIYSDLNVTNNIMADNTITATTITATNLNGNESKIKGTIKIGTTADVNPAISNTSLFVHGNALFYTQLDVPEVVITDSYVRIYKPTTFFSTVTETSDIRYKNNITDLPELLPEITNLKIFTYNWKDDTKITIGVSAQELQEKPTLRLLVNSDEENTLGVSYTKLSVVAIKCIQEQQKQIDELKKEIERLKLVNS